MRRSSRGRRGEGCWESLEDRGRRRHSKRWGGLKAGEGAGQVAGNEGTGSQREGWDLDAALT